jgi:hypothetical protein
MQWLYMKYMIYLLTLKRAGCEYACAAMEAATRRYVLFLRTHSE